MKMKLEIKDGYNYKEEIITIPLPFILHFLP